MSQPRLPEGTPGLLRRRLLDWYRHVRRDLPWRSSPNPWRILVSEFMLQQTRVAAVIPYYEKFLARFPDPASANHVTPSPTQSISIA